MTDKITEPRCERAGCKNKEAQEANLCGEVSAHLCRPCMKDFAQDPGIKRAVRDLRRQKMLLDACHKMLRAGDTTAGYKTTEKVIDRILELEPELEAEIRRWLYAGVLKTEVH